ncbi:hypothetical protein DFJ74DRAFT_667757 [Hyaloraphidium curvatum]|nr:hypothetical protein DFJ74DRAFT_667757 [Hyaloraphidium curvatum]
MGIDNATDYAEALASVANSGFDWAQAQIQLLSAQTKYVQDGLKLQAAQAQRDKVATVLARLRAQEGSLDLPAAVTEGYLDLLDGKMRALELFDQACDAYSFAYTAECPLRASGMAPNPTSPAAVFKAAVQGSLASLDDVFHGSSCFCNASFVVTDPGFIGNLTARQGEAVLDLSDITNPQLFNFFGPFDDVHIYQLNLKPYGIVPIDPPPDTTPTLTLDIRPVGLFTNTFSYSGGWYERQFLARPYGISVQMEPTNAWTVITPGTLSGLEAGKVYAPSPYARWSVRESKEGVAWDWGGVWGVQVEMWGKHAKRHSLSTGGAAPPSALQYCGCPGS